MKPQPQQFSSTEHNDASKKSFLNRMREWTSPYHFSKLSRFQAIVAASALFELVHFSIGSFLWGLMISAQMRTLFLASKPGQLTTNIIGWLPYFSRSWKSTLPLGSAIIALYFVPHRPRLSANLVAGILIFSVICACYDIRNENCDFHTFGPPWGGHMTHYFTWWWCHQRPE